MLNDLLKVAGNTEPGFARKIVKWAITCTSDGRFTGVIPLAEGRGQQYEYCPNLSQPELVSGGEKRSHFLVESLPVVALYWKDDTTQKDQDKNSVKHNYFCGLLESASRDAPYLIVAAKMLSDEKMLFEIQTDLKRQKAKPTETATVMVDRINPLERNDWKDWWRNFRKTLQAPVTKTAKMRCLATGELVEPLMTHPKVSGLAGVGGLPTKDALISFYNESYRSYGLDQSANAAVSEDSATAYAETLSSLIRDKGIKLGGAMATYWFLESVPDKDDPFPWLIEPPEQTQASAELKAKELLRAIHDGKRPDLANNRYFAIMLSGAAGRVMVREILQDTFESLTSNIDRWFNDLSIVDREGTGIARRPKFFSVVNAIEFLPKDGKILRNIDDVPPPLIRELWRSAITGGQIPSSAMSRTLMRIRSDIVSDLPPMETRFSIIKSYLVRKGDNNMQPYLNREHPHPAYHCGRLLAILARLQRKALGDVGAGVVQRYYAAASQTPGLILGRLVRNAQNHLGKPEMRGRTEWIEDWLKEIHGKLKDNMPRILTLEEQSLFALGYYQQLAALNVWQGDKQEDSNNKNISEEEKNL